MKKTLTAMLFVSSLYIPVFGQSTTSDAGWNVDITNKTYAIRAYNESNNTAVSSPYGIVATGYKTTNSSGATFGLRGDANGGAYSYGVHGSCSNAGVRNVAVWSSGDLVYTGSTYKASDAKLKEGILPLGNGLRIVNQLKPKVYGFKKEYSYMQLGKGKEAGLIAQDIQAVLPELVTENKFPDEFDAKGKKVRDGDLFLAVDYVKLVPYLIAAIQEQQQEIEALKAQNNGAKKGNLNDLAAAGLGQRAELFQNQPNPFSENTTIRYRLPDDVNAAQLYLYNMQGEQLEKFSLPKGSGSLTLKGGSLRAGMYIYALVADGKELDSKRMILTK
jgi:hypothetical protein